MPWGYSPNYDFKLAGETDNELFFIDWRTAINGRSDSNFMKVDTLLKGQQDRLDNLSSIQHMYYVSASKSETDDSYIATNPQIEAYNDNIMIMLSLTTANEGQVSLNINELGVIFVKKYNQESNLVDLAAGDFRANKIYILIFNKEQNVWIVVSNIDTDDLKAVGAFKQFRGVVENVGDIANPVEGDFAIQYNKDPSTRQSPYGFYIYSPILVGEGGMNAVDPEPRDYWKNLSTYVSNSIDLQQKYAPINYPGFVPQIKGLFPTKLVATFPTGTYVSRIDVWVKVAYTANAKLTIGNIYDLEAWSKSQNVNLTKSGVYQVEGHWPITSPLNVYLTISSTSAEPNGTIGFIKFEVN